MPRPKSNKPKKGFLDGYETYDPDAEGYGNVHEWRQTWEKMNGAQATAILQEDDPLVVLGFEAIPTESELNKRFRELMQQHHPDRGGDLAMAKRVTAAWTILTKRIR